MIWKRHLTLDELNATSDNTMVAHLGIVYTRLGDDVLEAEMPVDTRTHQPFGLLHGGASAALAETLGSMAGFMMTRDGQCVVGTELNATHHRPVSEGKVRGVCQPLHLGRQNQSWEIVVFDEQGRRCCTCRLGTAVLCRRNNNFQHIFSSSPSHDPVCRYQAFLPFCHRPSPGRHTLPPQLFTPGRICTVILINRTGGVNKEMELP